jgi:hypothetical protein
LSENFLERRAKECLLCKCETLSSNPSLIKKTRIEKIRMENWGKGKKSTKSPIFE